MASTMTHRKSVLWMNAAVGALAIARPVKNSRNGTLPPMTPMTAIVAHERRSMVRTWARGTTAAATTSRMAAATPFLRVVYTAASGSSFTA